MLRVLAVSLAVLAVGLGASAAERTAPPGGGPLDVTTTQSTSYLNSPAAPSPGEDAAAETELLEAANKSRELAGVPPLHLDDGLREAARAHARRMVSSERLEHQLSGEPVLLERIAEVSALKMDRAGENIANASCTSGANQALMQSAPHRKNLLDRGFNVAGIAAIWSEGRLYVVQDFAHEIPSYSVEQSRKLVSQAVDGAREQAGLPELAQLTPPHLDEAACSLARENRPNAKLLATAYDNRKIVAYTESRPEVLPPGALHMLHDPSIRQFAVGTCYARNAAYPTGMYWVAILLY